MERKVTYQAEESFQPCQGDLEEDLHGWARQVQIHLKNLEINEADITVKIDGKVFQRHHWSMWSVDAAICNLALSKMGIYDQDCIVIVSGER